MSNKKDFEGENRLVAGWGLLAIMGTASLIVACASGPPHHQSFGHASSFWKIATYVTGFIPALTIVGLLTFGLAWGSVALFAGKDITKMFGD